MPVLAPGDGEVVAAGATMPDNDVGHPAFDFVVEARRDLRRINGNYVMRDHHTGEYSLLCHIQQGRLTVRTGERVRQGQPFAPLGNSVAIAHAHLHYELSDGDDMRQSERLPVYFRRYRHLRGAQATAVVIGLPDTGDIVESAVPWTLGRCSTARGT